MTVWILTKENIVGKRKLSAPTLYPYVIEPRQAQPTVLHEGDIMEYDRRTSKLIIRRESIPCDDRLRWNHHKNYIMRPPFVNEDQFLSCAIILATTHGLECMWENSLTRYDWAVQFVKREQR